MKKQRQELIKLMKKMRTERHSKYVKDFFQKVPLCKEHTFIEVGNKKRVEHYFCVKCLREFELDGSTIRKCNI